MTVVTNKLALAALTGLLSAGLLTAQVAHAEQHGDNTGAMQKMEKSACKGKTSCKTKGEHKEKHACKGLNSCKGKGADGKNECKGKGSCRTDGKAEGEAGPEHTSQ